MQVLLSTMGKILAHEMAHVVGVSHDGEDNECDGKIAAHRSGKSAQTLFTKSFR